MCKTEGFEQLEREMEVATSKLDKLPKDAEWTADEVDALVGLRHAALKLTHMVEAVFGKLDGTKG